MILLLFALHLGRLVWACESDGQIVKLRDTVWRDGKRWHVSERDNRGRIVTICGVVHPTRIGMSTAVGLVGEVK